MKLVAMLSAAALVVALGLTAAQAQAPGNDISPGGPPSASPSAGGGAGPGAAPDMGPGGGSPGMMRDDRGAGAEGDRPGKSAESEGMQSPEGKAGKTEGELEGKSKAGKAEGELEGKSKTGKAEGELEGKSKTGKAEGELGAKGKAGTTAEGQTGGKSGKSVKLESQQVSKVRTFFGEHKPSVKAIEKTQVSVLIGVAIPSSVVLYDLPPDVIVVSGPCHVKYFVWGDDIVLVDSCTREVVEIIAGIA